MVKSLKKKTTAKKTKSKTKVKKDFDITKKEIKINDPKLLEEMLGPRKYRYTELENENMIGLTNGLAWTETGGDTLSCRNFSCSRSWKIHSDRTTRRCNERKLFCKS